MSQRLMLTFYMIILINSIATKSYFQSVSSNELKTHPSSRKIYSELNKHFWNRGSDDSPGLKDVPHAYDKREREVRRFRERKRRMICARHAAMQKMKRHLNQQHFRHEIKLYSDKENIRPQIENALLCNYERIKRELRKINVTLAPQDELETNFQIIIDSELAKAILQRLSILSGSSEEENTTTIAMTVKDNDKKGGELGEDTDKTDITNENETEARAEEENEVEDSVAETEVTLPEDTLTTEETSTEVPSSAEQDLIPSTSSPTEEEESTQSSVEQENELSTIFIVEHEEEPSSLPPTETTGVEEEPDIDESTEKEIDKNAENLLTCNFTAYQEMKIQCQETDDATEEGEGLPCSITGLWVSDAGGVQLDIKDGSSKGYLEVGVHDLTPPKKGFLSPSWRIIGQLPFLGMDMDGNDKDTESTVEDSLGGIFSLTATIPGTSSETGEKQLAIFIGQCHACEGGMDTVVGTWSLKRPSKNCRDALLSLQEIRDVLHRDILSESIKSKSRRMVNFNANKVHRGKLHRNILRRFH